MHNSWKSVKNVLFKKYFEKIFLKFFLKNTVFIRLEVVYSIYFL